MAEQYPKKAVHDYTAGWVIGLRVGPAIGEVGVTYGPKIANGNGNS